MKLSANHNFLALLLVFLSSITLPMTMHADNIDKRSGSFRRENRGINTEINDNRSYPNVYPPNINIYRPDYIRSQNIRLRGGGWYGSGYSTQLGWGSLTFTSGLALGRVISPPPYYSPAVVGRDNYIYSDGAFLQPRDSFYVVVKPPIGSVVPLIPEGCTSLNTNGVGYYNLSSDIYQPFHQDRNVVYRVVSY